MSCHLHLDGGVAEIHLDRPDRLNSLDTEMVADFHRALDEVGDARAVLVTAEGRAFSAGRDLSDAEPLTEDAEAILRDSSTHCCSASPTSTCRRSPPCRAPASASGSGVAFACDIVLVADDARIGSPFARIGAVLDSGGHRYLVERLGPHRALELIYTGRLLSGAEAAAIGLVNRSVPADTLRDEAQELAAAIAAGPTESFRESKRLVRALAPEPAKLATVLAAEGAAQGRIARSADYAEGITAFQDKRQPTFTGR